MTTTMERINQLSQERSLLIRQLSNGRRGDPALTERLHEVERELARLWEVRRRERAGRREGIDLVVEQAYRRIYGEDYEEAFGPVPVSTPEDEKALAAAA